MAIDTRFTYIPGFLVDFFLSVDLYRLSPMGNSNNYIHSCPITDPTFRSCYSNITFPEFVR